MTAGMDLTGFQCLQNSAAFFLGMTTAYKTAIIHKRQKLRERFPDCTITLSALAGSEVRCLLRATPRTPGVIQFPERRYFMPYVSASAILLQSLYPEKTALLEQQYPSMTMWADYIYRRDVEYADNGMWCNNDFHYGDWLALDRDDPAFPMGTVFDWREIK